MSIVRPIAVMPRFGVLDFIPKDSILIPPGSIEGVVDRGVG